MTEKLKTALKRLVRLEYPSVPRILKNLGYSHEAGIVQEAMDAIKEEFEATYDEGNRVSTTVLLPEEY